MSKNPQNKKFGYYLMLDIYGCDPAVIGDFKVCYNYLDELADILEVEKLSSPFVILTDGEKYPNKAGISAWVPFINKKDNTFTGASVHTLTMTNFVSLDIFSYKELDKKKIRRYVSKIFNPEKIEEKYIVRGENYFF